MATGTTEFFDLTVADLYLPELWSGFVIEAREQKLNMAQLVDTRWEAEVEAAGFGDRINIQDRPHLAARSKSANTAVSYETNTVTNIAFTFGSHYYAAFASEVPVDVQSMLGMAELYGPELGYSLALQIDDDLAGLIDDFTQAEGTLGDGHTFTLLRRGRQYLDDANAPDEDRFIVVSPAEESNYLTIDQLIHRDYQDLAQKPGGQGPERAYLGLTFMEMPIFKSTNVEGSNAAGHDNGLFQREALGLVRQLKARTHTWFDGDYLAQKFVAENLYGVREIRDDHGVFLRGL